MGNPLQMIYKQTVLMFFFSYRSCLQMFDLIHLLHCKHPCVPHSACCDKSPSILDLPLPCLILGPENTAIREPFSHPKKEHTCSTPKLRFRSVGNSLATLVQIGFWTCQKKTITIFIRPWIQQCWSQIYQMSNKPFFSWKWRGKHHAVGDQSPAD